MLILGVFAEKVSRHTER